MVICAEPAPLKITKIIIENFKIYKNKFVLKLNDGLNVIVGDNEAGKSTILEAINLALTGQINGRYVINELSQYLFNIQTVNEYCKSLTTEKPLEPPSLLIELYLSEYQEFRGTNNCEKKDCCGLFFSIKFDENYQDAYEKLCKSREIRSLPVEYYKVEWKSFALNSLIPRLIPLKSSFINSSETRFSNGSDIYLSRIIRDSLEDDQKIDLSQCYRRMVEAFSNEEAVKAINRNISGQAEISSKPVEISVEIANTNAWEKIITTYLDQIPFQQIGRGEQCIVKTNLALTHKRSRIANLILIEEPENHLSHSNLNKLLEYIKNKCSGKQIIITTHSSFVANKLGLEDLILLSNQYTTSFNDLERDTYAFFSKLPGYDTLRLLLAKGVILVEGDCDELVVQKIYAQQNDGRLPIHNGIDVISVGLSYKRFFEIAKKIDKKVAAIRDNDGKITSIKNNDAAYLKENNNKQVLFYDPVEHEYKGEIEKYNYNTLEPCLLRSNSLETLNSIFRTNFATEDEILNYMRTNKTDCALKIFETEIHFDAPGYIKEAIEFVNE
ncbi:ATP-dependent endonuclease of the OLD family [Alkalidesulfovibrio alkalitolerans DSM 16529]|uniref:ATP-dependent endonuclease of the OLD family n=1 Tax=Alkalidesulfovibrio alkalitolerans DSM 16529 TaxID=1121439 RepID=S7T4K3_9BACT|nr:AAA family ATPase [Alkalidesulfovibrio alkalitolerans]EPR31400.1 ATP-dependent endonuclease of the OLD family [Alkalidesulfovibrio alkalitolerans DSM 16529]